MNALKWSPRQQVAMLGIIVVAAGILALSGWRGRMYDTDWVPHVEDAHRLLCEGRIPQKGCVSSLGSFIPPGTTWLLVPGMLGFRDPRLFTVVGGGLLFIGATAGVFVLTRALAGRTWGLLAAGVYAFSWEGYQVWNLWPRFHQFFSVWYAYCLMRWIAKRDVRFLGVALALACSGLLVSLEGLPIVLVIPVCCLFFRCRVSWRAVMVAAVYGAVLWSPFLGQQWRHDFRDLRSQITRTSIVSLRVSHIWCNPAVIKGIPELAEPVHTTDSKPGKEPTGGARPIGIVKRLANAWLNSALWLKETVSSLGANFASLPALPWTVYLGACLLFVASAIPFLRRGVSSQPEERAPGWQLWLGWCMVASAAVCNEWLLSRILSSDGRVEDYTITAIRCTQGAMAFAGFALVLGRRIVQTTDRRDSLLRLRGQVVVLAWAVPFLIMLALGRAADRHVSYLWPIQLALVSSLLAQAATSRGAVRVPTAALAAGLGAVLLVNTWTVAAIRSWIEKGWPGRSDERIVLDCLARYVRKSGRTHAAIGYEIPFWGFEAKYHAIDRRYRVGCDHDLYLKYKHGVSNDTSCPEGVSERDTYRFIEGGRGRAGQVRINPPRDGFELVERRGKYALYRRARAGSRELGESL